MKKLSKFLAAALLITFVIGFLNVKPVDAATYKAGDIFTTTTTSFNGLTGHVGIAINSTQILHTSGWKSEKYPTVISIKDFQKRYKNKIKVIRPNDSKLGAKAADMAVKYFKNKKIKYRITTNPKDIDPNTYCSELVWYSYYKAGKTYKQPSITSQGRTNWITPSIIYPSDFNTSMTVKHNGFKFIDNKW